MSPAVPEDVRIRKRRKVASLKRICGPSPYVFMSASLLPFLVRAMASSRRTGTALDAVCPESISPRGINFSTENRRV